MTPITEPLTPTETELSNHGFCISAGCGKRKAAPGHRTCYEHGLATNRYINMPAGHLPRIWESTNRAGGAIFMASCTGGWLLSTRFISRRMALIEAERHCEVYRCGFTGPR